ncbi:hypothetical protein SAMN05421688_3345 [Poseidonocella pacifica]|uniref:Zinc-ribbon domain-containing protein n=1 Tax=Poseidonocella pacifica TaxID=871651 RepID=A0A1I0YXG9_9RHOB|nr:hypothetical protein [Poseidonocella pacifica]SFB16763.1 hypothetical protein SAMN05421688_3345 [Poseidonocella pacifica]
MTQPDHNIPPAVPLAVTTPIPAHWRQMARDKGFRLTRRGADRYQIMLECDRCGREHRSMRNVLMDHVPLCPHCVEDRWRKDAATAGLEWLRRDPDHHRHGFYRAGCGHTIRRQFGRVRQIARGEHALRCETCQRQREEAEACAAGWKLIGPAVDRGPNYRLYRHSCGHEQELARTNMQSERFCCGRCGVGWATAPSFLYCMRFGLPNAQQMVIIAHGHAHWQGLRGPGGAKPNRKRRAKVAPSCVKGARACRYIENSLQVMFCQTEPACCRSVQSRHRAGPACLAPQFST